MCLVLCYYELFFKGWFYAYAFLSFCIFFLWGRFLEEWFLVPRINTCVILLDSIKSPPRRFYIISSNASESCFLTEYLRWTLREGEYDVRNLWKLFHKSGKLDVWTRVLVLLVFDTLALSFYVSYGSRSRPLQLTEEALTWSRNFMLIWEY